MIALRALRFFYRSCEEALGALRLRFIRNHFFYLFEFSIFGKNRDMALNYDLREIKSLAKKLEITLRAIGEQFNIAVKSEE